MSLALRESRMLVLPRRAFRAVKKTVKPRAERREGLLASWENTMTFGADLVIKGLR